MATSPTSTAAASASTAGLAPLIEVLQAPEVDRNCQLLGPLSLVIQACMGIVVVSALLLKRAHESPKRPWRIWLYDVGKQLFGQAFVHGLNVLLSSGISHWTGSRGGHQENACVLYFVNILLDVTLGVLLLWAFLKAFNYLLVVRLGLNDYRSGHYGKPPSARTWGKQVAVYVASISLMKIVVLAIIAVFPSILRFGDWLLLWLPSNDAEIAFVVLIWPLCANAAQFVIVDQLIKGKGLALLHHDDHDDEEAESMLPEDHAPKHISSPAFPPVR